MFCQWSQRCVHGNDVGSDVNMSAALQRLVNFVGPRARVVVQHTKIYNVTKVQ